MTFSALLRTPHDVIGRLDEGDVLLTRRGEEPLLLSKAKASDAESDTVEVLAQLIAVSLDDRARDRIAEGLADVFPWIELLPSTSRREFVSEFLRVARACAAVAKFGRLTVCLQAWRETATAYADPVLTPDGSDLDYLVVPEPVSDPRAA